MKIKAFYGRYGFKLSRSDSGINTLGGYIKYSQIEWTGIRSKTSPLALFTDGFLKSRWIAKSKNTINVGISLEPREINPRIFQDMQSCHGLLDLILTHDKEICKKFENASYFVTGGTLFKNHDFLQQREKNGRISIVISDKKVTEGHRLRHEILEFLGNSELVDVFGIGVNPFEDRNVPFSEYSYTIVVENVKSEVFLTEKLIDPLLVCCVPIYWGASNIDDFFDGSGIIHFNNLQDLKRVIDSVSKGEVSIPHATLKRNQRFAVDLMSKEWNIQTAISKELYGINLPKLSSLIPDFDSFVAGKITFGVAEPEIFRNQKSRNSKNVGIQSRLHFVGEFIRLIQSLRAKYWKI